MQLRFDRLVSLYLASPLVRFAGGSQRSVPILMYHGIAEEDEPGVHAYYRTKTSPAIFAKQLQYLHDNGYTSCSLAQAVQRLQGKTAAAEKLVVITFDDGFHDFYLEAFPALNRFGFSATVFLPTAFIGDSPVAFKGKDCMTWAEVRELHRQGIQFGSHTVTHPQLHDLSPAKIQEEIANSKHTIEEELGEAIDSFAYPYAFPQTDTAFKSMLRDTLGASGYRYGVCTIVGRAQAASDNFFMERLPMNSADDSALLSAKLCGAYDWVGKAQSLAKAGKGLLRRSESEGKYRVSKDFPAIP